MPKAADTLIGAVLISSSRRMLFWIASVLLAMSSQRVAVGDPPAHAKRDCSERFIGLSLPIGAFGAQNKQPGRSTVSETFLCIKQ